MQLDDAVRKHRPSERPFRCSFEGVRNGVKCRFYAIPKHEERGSTDVQLPPFLNCTAQRAPSRAFTFEQGSFVKKERTLTFSNPPLSKVRFFSQLPESVFLCFRARGHVDPREAV